MVSGVGADVGRDSPRLVTVVGASLATLGRRLPGVVRVSKLSLGQLVQAFRFRAQDLELVPALLRIGLDGTVGIVRDIVICLIGGGLIPLPAEDPSQESHCRSVYAARLRRRGGN